MTTALDGRAAREAFMAKVRERIKEAAPYFVDHGGGFGGSTVVCGPTLRAGFILQSGTDKRPEILADQLNGAWGWGYEQGKADEAARAALRRERRPEYFALCETTTFYGRDDDEWFVLEWWGPGIGWAVYEAPTGGSLYACDSGPREEAKR